MVVPLLARFANDPSRGGLSGVPPLSGRLGKMPGSKSYGYPEEKTFALPDKPALPKTLTPTPSKEDE
jgi:hypothetical protein